MLAALLHCGWNTLTGAAVFWLSWFTVAFLIVRWAIRKGKIAPPHGWFASLLGSWALLVVGTLLAFYSPLAPSHWAGHFIYSLWVLSIFVVLGTLAYGAAFSARRVRYYWRKASHGKVE
jgi:hypothetical protein